MLHISCVGDDDFVLETSFLLTPLNQFDQCGIAFHVSEGACASERCSNNRLNELLPWHATMRRRGARNRVLDEGGAGVRRRQVPAEQRCHEWLEV